MEFETPLGRIILQFAPKKRPDSLRPSRERPSAWRGENVCYWRERRIEGYNSSYGIESKLEKPSRAGQSYKKKAKRSLLQVNIYIKGSIKKLPLGFELLERVDSLQLKMVSDIFPHFFSIYLALKSQDWLWVVYLSLAISMIRNLLISADLPCSLF
jgi:hypothetical protein